MAKKDWHISLKDRESVRTTFKLSETGWKSLDKLAKWHSVTFKDVFDSICMDVLERKKAKGEKENPVSIIISDITNEMKEEGRKKWEEDTSRKTQVISRGAIRTLYETAYHWQVPRDALVDSALRFYMAHHENILEKTRKKHEKAAKLIYDLCLAAEALESELEELLDEGDPILMNFHGATIMLDQIYSVIEDSLQGGKPLDAGPHYILEEND